MEGTSRNNAHTWKTSFSRLHFWFILISFQNVFPKFKLPNLGSGLSASAAYTPVFTVTLSCRRTDFGQSIWPAGDQLTTAFTILNHLEYEFLKGFFGPRAIAVTLKIFHPFRYPGLTVISSKKWKIHSQLSVMFTCRNGRGGEHSS